jgi:hypothetical protein
MEKNMLDSSIIDDEGKEIWDNWQDNEAEQDEQIREFIRNLETGIFLD